MKLFLSGLISGLIPHAFCILFITFSIFGVTAAVSLFKPLLLSKNFFYFLIVFSFLFATFSAVLYLKRNKILSLAGIKRKWRYLSLMYSLTIFINLFLFLVIFPAKANFSPTDKQVLSSAIQIETLILKVDIPCSGHAPLVTEELKRLDGIVGVEFQLPNIFKIFYDKQKITENKIINQNIFKNFRATTVQ